MVCLLIVSKFFSERLADEINIRKKLENSLADAQRVITEKETQLQDLKITMSQNHNAHLDTQKDRDSLHSALNQTQQAYDSETIARSDLQNLANQLREKLDFERTIHDRVSGNDLIFTCKESKDSCSYFL